MPDYAASNKEVRSWYRGKECEICGTKRRVFVFTREGSKKLRCACKKHLRRIS